MLRTITLSLLLLVSIGVMLPIASTTAHGIHQSVEAQPTRRHRRHSRAWWRRYHARLRARRAANLAAMAHRNAPLSGSFVRTASNNAIASTAQVPGGWIRTASDAGEMKFRTNTDNSTVPGQASLAVVALSRPEPAYLTMREQRRILSGVALADLRRIVIDKMMTSGGWVINDYERDVTGHRVFVVTARTPADARTPEKSWNFYFTEVNGRIYSLTTNTPPQFAERMEVEAERFMASLYPTSGDSAAAVATENR